MAIEYSLGAEELHKIGEVGAKRIRTWLDSTFRFRIDHSIHDLDQHGHPYTRLRVPQLQDGRFERFDLVGNLLGEDTAPGRTIYVECKNLSDAGNQGTQYNEYLAVCYSAFVALSLPIDAPADVEFMWATTHPFAVGSYARLVTAGQIAEACEEHASRLGGHNFDETIAAQLAGRLWLAVVNSRVEEMMMGLELRKAVVSRMLELSP
jgi:hypothetical protein